MCQARQLQHLISHERVQTALSGRQSGDDDPTDLSLKHEGSCRADAAVATCRHRSHLTCLSMEAATGPHIDAIGMEPFRTEPGHVVA
jgi:hypothetical protein